MLLALTLLLALPAAPQYSQRSTAKPPLPGYGLGPMSQTQLESQQRSTIQLPAHLMRAPRTQDERSSRIDWLREHVPVVQAPRPWPRSTELPEDFSDLAPLKQAIGERRIVSLGEASHGDGHAFRIKARLVRFLHQECGFDLLVFESGLYDCDAAWRQAEAGADLAEVGLRALQPVWARSQTVRDLFAYMQANLASERPLRLAGMDLMPTSPFMAEVHGELLGLGTQLELDEELLTSGLGLLEDFPKGFQAFLAADDEEREFQLEGLHEVGHALGQASKDSTYPEPLRQRAAFLAQFIESFGAAVQMIARTDFSIPEGDSELNRRDVQMAANVAWLAKLAHPSSKLILWGATSHLSRARRALDVRTARSMVPLGEHLTRSMPGQVYHLGVTAYAGSIGSASAGQPQVLQPAPRGSLEELLQATGRPAAFLDFSSLAPGAPWLGQELSLRAMGHADVRGAWSQALDGIYFVREAQPVLTLQR